jgi:hypothetical protein
VIGAEERQRDWYPPRGLIWSNVALTVAFPEVFTPGNVTPTGDEKGLCGRRGVVPMRRVQVFRQEPVLGPAAFNIDILSVAET